jgi:hypothetical protein
MRGLFVPPWCALLLLLGTADAWALETVQEESRRVYPSAGLKAVSVDNPRGRIEFLPGAADSVELVAIKTARGETARDARELAAQTSVEVDRTEGTLNVRVRYPQAMSSVRWFNFDHSGRHHRGPQVTIRMRIPARLSASGRTSSGTAVASGVAGPLSLNSTSGDLRVEDAGGVVELRTTSGDITARSIGSGSSVVTVSGDVRVGNARGAITVRSTSGDLRITEVGGPLEVSSVSGEVMVRDAAAGLVCSVTSGDVVAHGVRKAARVTSSSGDLDVQVVGPVEGAELSTASGDVVLRLSPETRGELELRTGSGEIQVRTALAVKTVSRHLVTGAVGGGGPPLRVRTSSGEVQVIREGEQP